MKTQASPCTSIVVWTNGRKSVIENKRNKAFFKDAFPPLETPAFPKPAPLLDKDSSSKNSVRIPH